MLCDKQQVENEFHIFMVWILYGDQRNSLVEKCYYNLCPMSQHSALNDVLVFIMSDSTMARHTAKACRSSLNRRQSSIYAQ